MRRTEFKSALGLINLHRYRDFINFYVLKLRTIITKTVRKQAKPFIVTKREKHDILINVGKRNTKFNPLFPYIRKVCM